MRSNAVAKPPLIFTALRWFLRRHLEFLRVNRDIDSIVARNVARKCENLRLNSFRDVLSIWRRQQCVSFNCGLICHQPWKDHISNVSLEGFLHSHLRLELYKDETAVMTVRMREILSIPKRLCAGGALCCHISVWLILCKRIIWFLFLFRFLVLCLRDSECLF